MHTAPLQQVVANTDWAERGGAWPQVQQRSPTQADAVGVWDLEVDDRACGRRLKCSRMAAACTQPARSAGHRSRPTTAGGCQRRQVLAPATSTWRAAGLGSPPTSTPTSVEVPPAVRSTAALWQMPRCRSKPSQATAPTYVHDNGLLQPGQESGAAQAVHRSTLERINWELRGRSGCRLDLDDAAGTGSTGGGERLPESQCTGSTGGGERLPESRGTGSTGGG